LLKGLVIRERRQERWQTGSKREEGRDREQGGERKISKVGSTRSHPGGGLRGQCIKGRFADATFTIIKGENNPNVHQHMDG
jgi:hypothetical protein